MLDNVRLRATAAERRFRRLGIATVVLVYLVILAGGIVRTTGSGMGCPDWPKCFGQWVPPTDVSQLPADYATRYAIPGHVPEFNVIRTWTEYLNRLLGALAGLAVFATLLASRPYWRTARHIVWASLAAFLLMGFQGWLGAQVVSLVLVPWIVTLHMLLALVIVFLLVYAVGWPQIRPQGTAPAGVLAWSAFGLALVLVQVVLGTQLREAVDHAAAAGLPRSAWLRGAAEAWFQVHRSFSWAVVLPYAVLAVRSRGFLRASGAWAASLRMLGALLLLTAAFGIVLAYVGMPAWAQPLHLLLATLTAGGYFFTLLVVIRMRRNPAAATAASLSSPQALVPGTHVGH